MIVLILLLFICGPAKIFDLELLSINSFLSMFSCCLTEERVLSLFTLRWCSLSILDGELKTFLTLIGYTVLLMQFNSPMSRTGIFLDSRTRICFSEDFQFLNIISEVYLFMLEVYFLLCCDFNWRKGLLYAYSIHGSMVSLYSALFFIFLLTTKTSSNLYLGDGWS